MKKVLSLILALAVMLAVLTGCGGNTTNTTGGANSTTGTNGAANDPGFSGPANTVGNTAGNLSGSGFAAIQGDTIYFCSNSSGAGIALCSVKTDGSGLKILTDLSSEETKHTGCPKYINVIGDTIYYYSVTNSAIYRMKTNGKDLKKLSDQKMFCDYMAVADGMIYYVADYKLFSMKIDGTDKKDLGLETAKCFNMADGMLYYQNMGHIYSMKTDGADQKVLADNYAKSILVADGTIYYTDTQAIHSMKTDGTDQKTLFEDEGRVNMLQMLNSKLYFVVDDTNVFSINTDGTGKTPVFSDNKNVTWMDFVGDWIYYGNEYSGFAHFSRIKTDGSGKELLPSYDDIKK